MTNERHREIKNYIHKERNDELTNEINK